MKGFALSVFLAGLFSSLAVEGRYHSRPDLSPPTLNITVPADESRISPGYIFVAQYAGFADGASGPEQPGAYIFRDDGDLVWSGLNYLAGWITDLRPDTLASGEHILHAFQGEIPSKRTRFYGNHVILNSRYEVMKVIGAKNHRLVSAHEFNIIDGKTVLIETPVTFPVDLAKYGGDETQSWIVSSGFQELDLTTGELVFEWYCFDHVDPLYTALPINSGYAGTGRNASDSWNYFHINSVDKNADGDYLVSARNYAALFKVNGTSGDVIWQLGGAYSNRSSLFVPADAHFAYQHNARFVSQSVDDSIETISIFDNSAHTGLIPVNPFSRGRVLQLNHTSRSVTALRTLPAPDGLSADSQGSLQLLPNDHVFMNWGEAGAVSEFGSDNGLLFHAYLDSAPAGKLVQSYRATRSNWTGMPTEDPALVVSNRTAYVSWNGDTETALWRFYCAMGAGEKKLLIGEVERTSFETRFVLPTNITIKEPLSRFSAEAVDTNGKKLVASRDVFLDSI